MEVFFRKVGDEKDFLTWEMQKLSIQLEFKKWL